MPSNENLRSLIDQTLQALPEQPPEYDAPAPGSEHLAQTIDHTLLKLDATAGQIDTLCDEARKFKFAAVCVRLQWVERCVCNLKGSSVRVACVIGFHEGTQSTQEKADEAAEAVIVGARELDMVMNWPQLKERQSERVCEDVLAVRKAASGGVILKTILETSQLKPDDIVAACTIAEIAGADFVKTSTGFCGQGASLETVRLMKRVVGDRCKVKASGGVRTMKDLVAMIQAGAERIGTSSGVAIMQEALAVSEIGTNDALDETVDDSKTRIPL